MKNASFILKIIDSLKANTPEEVVKNTEEYLKELFNAHYPEFDYVPTEVFNSYNKERNEVSICFLGNGTTKLCYIIINDDGLKIEGIKNMILHLKLIKDGSNNPKRIVSLNYLYNNSLICINKRYEEAKRDVDGIVEISIFLGHGYNDFKVTETVNKSEADFNFVGYLNLDDKYQFELEENHEEWHHLFDSYEVYCDTLLEIRKVSLQLYNICLEEFVDVFLRNKTR